MGNAIGSDCVCAFAWPPKQKERLVYCFNSDTFESTSEYKYTIRCPVKSFPDSKETTSQDQALWLLKRYNLSHVNADVFVPFANFPIDITKYNSNHFGHSRHSRHSGHSGHLGHSWQKADGILEIQIPPSRASLQFLDSSGNTIAESNSKILFGPEKRTIRKTVDGVLETTFYPTIKGGQIHLANHSLQESESESVRIRFVYLHHDLKKMLKHEKVKFIS